MLTGGKWTWRVQHCESGRAWVRCFVCRHDWVCDVSGRQPGEFLRHLEDWLTCPACGCGVVYFRADPVPEENDPTTKV